MPFFNMVYGTAWKEDRTTELVSNAIHAGFRAVDTASEKDHYREDLVGSALRNIYAENEIRRDEIHIQTKFTPNIRFADGHENPLPLSQQVQESVQKSLFDLRAYESEDTVESSYLDCVILHAPMRMLGDTLKVWASLESFVPTRIRSLGISNITIGYLEVLFPLLNVKPTIVQNAITSAPSYDAAVRNLCKAHEIVYQAFRIVKDCPLLSSPVVTRLALLASVSDYIALCSLLLSFGGISILNGTEKELRMKEDIAGLVILEDWKLQHGDEWNDAVADFNALIKEDRRHQS